MHQLDSCFEAGTCQDGECVSDTPVDCDDGIDCTLIRVMNSRVVFIPRPTASVAMETPALCPHVMQRLCVSDPVMGPCDDGDPCTSDDQCAEGSCSGEAIANCGCVEDADCVDLDDGNLAMGRCCVSKEYAKWTYSR